MTEITQRTKISYVNRSWEDVVQASIDKLSELNPEWTDHSPLDLGITILEAMAYLSDLNHYYIDKMVNESYPETALQRRSLLRMADFNAYTPANYEPAIVTLRFGVQSSHPKSIIIPVGTYVSGRGKRFYTVEGVVLSPGATSVDVKAVQGIQYKYSVESTGFSDYIIPDNHISSSRSIRVLVNGEEWEKVPAFNDSYPESKHYVVSVDEDYYVHITFGNNLYGSLPTNATIEVYYNSNLGIDGGVAKNSISTVTSTIYDGDNDVVDILVNNTEAASGGSNPPSVDLLRYIIKGLNKKQDRSLDKPDIEVTLMKSNFVKQARVYDVRDDRSIGYYMVHCYVLVDTFTTTLRRELEDFIEYDKYTTLQYKIFEVTEVSVMVSCDVVLLPSHTIGNVKATMLEALSNFFQAQEFQSDTGLTIGETIHYSDLVAVLEAVTGVDYVQLTINDLTNNDIIVGIGELVTLGSVTIEQII